MKNIKKAFMVVLYILSIVVALGVVMKNCETVVAQASIACNANSLGQPQRCGLPGTCGDQFYFPVPLTRPYYLYVTLGEDKCVDIVYDENGRAYDLCSADYKNVEATDVCEAE